MRRGAAFDGIDGMVTYTDTHLRCLLLGNKENQPPDKFYPSGSVQRGYICHIIGASVHASIN
jgi:hypothetical protein